jgi:RNA polymerase sigma factor (sigma-70 family)
MWLDTSFPGKADSEGFVVDIPVPGPSGRAGVRASSRAAANAEIEVLYRKEAPPLRLFVKRTLRSATDCEDIVQDAFVRTWRAMKEGRVRSPRAVLFKTARNLALNHIRNNRARTSDATRAALTDAFARPATSAEEEIIASEQAEGCRQLLDGLPSRCREAFVLRVVDELSYHDMSKVMQLSISTIEKHVGKGKQICRERLAAAERDGDPMLGAILSTLPAGRTVRWAPTGDLLLAAE